MSFFRAHSGLTMRKNSETVKCEEEGGERVVSPLSFLSYERMGRKFR